MHNAHDEEFDSSEDQPSELGINSDVLSVHKMTKQKGAGWRGEQQIKILKGGNPGWYKSNMFVTLEFCFGRLTGGCRKECKKMIE